MVDIVLNNEIKQLEKIKLMTEMQKMVEDLDINAADNMIIDNKTEVDENNTNKDDKEEIDFPQYMNLNKKKRRKENIIKHKLNENSDYTFLVKWKDYDSNNNSWVNEKDFNTKDLIKDYFWTTMQMWSNSTLVVLPHGTSVPSGAILVIQNSRK
ncbi:hypothetical protein INT46_007569 [Mucor plumbeus]|uniref:Chromo domain-containing protein n=1 Tax=Mucor plumbeus TaxID=97098 RepID=A0A8H7UT68_9FUNG|nr:hypothetical protein INT46_007569 [Mucor plumbeus]